METKLYETNRQMLDKRRAAARRFALPRAEFSRLFVRRFGLPANPSDLTAEETDRIRTHPQFVDPVRCPQSKRIFNLTCVSSQV